MFGSFSKPAQVNAAIFPVKFQLGLLCSVTFTPPHISLYISLETPLLNSTFLSKPCHQGGTLTCLQSWSTMIVLFFQCSTIWNHAFSDMGITKLVLVMWIWVFYFTMFYRSSRLSVCFFGLFVWFFEFQMSTFVLLHFQNGKKYFSLAYFLILSM